MISGRLNCGLCLEASGFGVQLLDESFPGNDPAPVESSGDFFLIIHGFNGERDHRTVDMNDPGRAVDAGTDGGCGQVFKFDKGAHAGFVLAMRGRDGIACGEFEFEDQGRGR